MKIHHILGGVSVIVTNEEREFIRSHRDIVPLASLDEREVWIAQNLVRKNVYNVSEDSNSIILNRGHGTDRSIV